MANTYSQCYFHLVFSPNYRDALIGYHWKNNLEKYITAIVQNRKHKMLQINTMPDHLHMLIGYNLNHLVPDLVEEVKVSTNLWIKSNGFCRHRFSWQAGYGAFTVSRSLREGVIRYIAQQEEHHRVRTFREEYSQLLEQHEIEFEEQYLFEFFDDVKGWQDV